MNLLEFVQQIENLDVELTVYARRPWKIDSDAELVAEGSEEEEKAKAAGLRYFVEVPIAREFLEDWRANVIKSPTVEQCCERLIKYAEHDA